MVACKARPPTSPVEHGDGVLLAAGPAETRFAAQTARSADLHVGAHLARGA